MAWRSGANSPLGISVPGTIDTSPSVAVGTVSKFYDPVQGEGTFIYLPGVASVADGDAVVYDLNPGAQAIVRAASGTHANSGRPVAFAVGALVASTYGWYQIEGVAIASVLAGFAAGNLFLSATAGSVDDGAINGAQILGARGSSAIGTPAANKAYVTISRPHIQGQIT
ncbi:MAG: hypothetical protein E6Q97_32450 [Desulfurellales bacterium]|nr:MAG: hypothetical protein E6Q97_32450 [Desulfurellales bacterium]